MRRAIRAEQMRTRPEKDPQHRILAAEVQTDSRCVFQVSHAGDRTCGGFLDGRQTRIAVRSFRICRWELPERRTIAADRTRPIPTTKRPSVRTRHCSRLPAASASLSTRCRPLAGAETGGMSPCAPGRAGICWHYGLHCCVASARHHASLAMTPRLLSGGGAGRGWQKSAWRQPRDTFEQSSSPGPHWSLPPANF